MNDTIMAGGVGNAELLTIYHNEVSAELKNILAYWIGNTIDTINGGFIGEIDENNISNPAAPKGSVLNARILWSLSAAYKVIQDPEYLRIAAVAFTYFTGYFMDQEFGGVYWSVTAGGEPSDTKKQIYALAFGIYGCSAYFEISNDASAKKTAIELYHQIEAHSFDKEYTGYLEAFRREWTPLDDLRLSNKDANEKKTMNTHLHILEAYTALYRIWPEGTLKTKIQDLLKNFIDHIVNTDTGHLILFFDEQWNSKSTIVSYGHDIEAAWLLNEAALAIEDQLLIEKIKILSKKIATAAAEGLDNDGGLWYEYETNSNHLIKEKHWWVQAEAMIGFFNHWQVTHDDGWLKKSFQSWQYINAFICDKKYGEWLWGRNGDGSKMAGQDKVGFWKCPYHNSRACIEIINRIQHNQ